MTAKERLIQEIEQTPEPIIQEVLDFLYHIKEKYKSNNMDTVLVEGKYPFPVFSLEMDEQYLSRENMYELD